MRKQNTTRSIEAEGFRDGTQGIVSEPALDEINAHFAGLKEQERHNTTERIKSLEGMTENLEQRKLDADRHWVDLEMMTGGMPPQVALPLCAVLLSVLVVTGEAVFLAPVMDGFGIADPTWQYLLAAVIVIVCAGLIEITKRQWTAPQNEQSSGAGSEREQQLSVWAKRVFFCFMTALALLLVSALGWWRADEMMFAASAQPGAWQKFLSQNPTLTHVVVLLLTTGLSVFVGLAFEWGLGGLRFAWEWRKARRNCVKTGAQLAMTRKSLESEEEKKESKLNALDELCNEWKQAYLQKYELGQRVGARRLPLLQVLLKIGALILLLLVGCLLIEPILSKYIFSDSTRYLLYGCATIGLTGLYAAHALKIWDRPNAKQLYRQQGVQWQNVKGEAAPPGPYERNIISTSNNGATEQKNFYEPKQIFPAR